MDVDDCAHKVASSLPLLPEDIQSFPCMLLMRIIKKKKKKFHHVEAEVKTTNTVCIVRLPCLLVCINYHNKPIVIGEAMLELSTSNTDSPESRLSAANSKIMVPAHAVQVSVSVPVRDKGLRTP